MHAIYAGPYKQIHGHVQTLLACSPHAHPTSSKAFCFCQVLQLHLVLWTFSCGNVHINDLESNFDMSEDDVYNIGEI